MGMNRNGLYAQAPDYAGGGMVPASNFGSAGGSGGMLGGTNPAMAGGGIAGLLQGIFGNSGGPYEDAMKQYQHYMEQSQNALNPYAQAGQGAMGNYQQWLQGMQDPSKFINEKMGQYQESPWAKYQQQQAMRAATNAASMGGLSNGMGGAGIGSTPFLQQAQQNASNISSQDMGSWLQNVLGINSQYGQGQQNLMNQGFNASNSLANMYNNMGQQMGGAVYGRRAGKDQDFWNMIGGGAQLGLAFL